MTSQWSGEVSLGVRAAVFYACWVYSVSSSEDSLSHVHSDNDPSWVPLAASPLPVKGPLDSELRLAAEPNTAEMGNRSPSCVGPGGWRWWGHTSSPVFQAQKLHVWRQETSCLGSGSQEAESEMEIQVPMTAEAAILREGVSNGGRVRDSEHRRTIWAEQDFRGRSRL